MKSQSKLYSRYFTYIKPVTQAPFVKTYGATVFTLLITTFFILYAIKPTIETILVLQKKLTNSTAVLEKVNQKARNLSQGKQNLEKLDPNIKSKINNLIPDTISLRSIIQPIEQSAKLHQASVSALQIQPAVIEPRPENNLGTVESVGFNFNISGDYKNLLLILQDLKNIDRLISIDNISLSISEGSGLIMSISGKAYFIK